MFTTSRIRPNSVGFMVIIALLIPGLASAQTGFDEVGVYFDTDYTQNVDNEVTAPIVMNGYLVLQKPTATGGVAGWELCASLDGPAQFVGWTLEGQVINTLTPPCFAVGIGGPPLPVREHVLLASFLLFVQEQQRVTISLDPKYNASIPGQMSYIDSAQPGVLLPLSTVTGNPEVAFINNDIPSYQVDPVNLRFLDTNLGETVTKSVTVTNTGGGILDLDIGLSGPCDGFSLPGLSGPVSLAEDESAVIQVSFSPETTAFVDCALVLGDIVPNVFMAGSGHDPIISYTVYPTAVNFGNVPTEIPVIKLVTITNTGEANITIEPVVDDPTGSFALAGTGGLILIQPGHSTQVRVAFTPMTPGSFTGTLNLGDTVGPVPLSGSAFIGAPAWDAPETVDFGMVLLDRPKTLPVVVSNIGSAVFSITPSIDDPQGVFTVTSGTNPVQLSPGESHTIYVLFSPTQIVAYTAVLDLGLPVGQIALLGTGTDQLPSVTAPPLVDFGTVGVGSAATRQIPVTNTGQIEFSISPSLLLPSMPFSIILGGGTITLHPGETHNITVRFAPTAVTSYFQVLALGAQLSQVMLVGSGGTPGLSWIAPTLVDFGTVIVGTEASRTINVQNTGSISFTLDVSIPAFSDFYIISGGGSYVIPSGASHSITIGFLPQTEGQATGALNMGSTVPTVALSGTGRQPVTSFTLVPEVLNLGPIAAGFPVTGAVTVINTGTTIIEIDAQLIGGDPGFSLTSGAGVHPIQPGASWQGQVRFESAVPGSFATTLNLGTPVPDVPVTATVEVAQPGCSVSPTNLVFGSVQIGFLETRYVTINNTGNIPLTCSPSLPSCNYFSADTTSFQIAPHQQHILQVHFMPLTEGFFTCNLDLGIGDCSPVLCNGSGITGGWTGSTENLAGVFFDPGFTEYHFQTLHPNEIVTGYLVLQFPTDQSGVAGWEGCLDLEGNAAFVDFQVQGQFINVDSPPCFAIGIGGSPLPTTTPAVLLASFQCLVSSPWSEVDIMFGPTQRPSIAGYSAWVSWADRSTLIPMQALPGQVVLATINNGLVSNEAPTPLASVTAGGVALSWELASIPDEGCHVYRRQEGRGEVKLTPVPIIPQGHTFTFTDPAYGLAPGSQVHYSYAIMRGGVEEVRSPEVTVTLSGVPVTRTRLLPNQPNPFNPQTEVRFDVADAGHVRITIYDVTGRKVATLVDEDMSPGQKSRLWQGRDDAGRALPSGAYYLKLESENRIDHRKVMLLK